MVRFCQALAGQTVGVRLEVGKWEARPREPTDIFTNLTTVTHLQGVAVEFVYYTASQP